MNKLTANAITAHWLRLAVPATITQENANALAASATKIKTATASSQSDAEYAMNDKGRYVRLLFEDGTDHRFGDIKVVELVEVRVVKADASAAAAVPPAK